MDPTLSKLLENNEDDEGFHSVADIELFSAELNRQIQGGSESENEQQPSQGDLVDTEPSLDNRVEKVISPPGKKQTRLEQVESRSDYQQAQEETYPVQTCEKEKDKMSEKITIQDLNTIHGPEMVLNHQKQQIKLQRRSKKTENSNQANLAIKNAKVLSDINFRELMPLLHAHLDKNRSMKLEATFMRLVNNEVSKEDFLRLIRKIVGDRMLRQKVHNIMMQIHDQTDINLQSNANQHALEVQAFSQQVSEQQFHSLQLVPSQSLKVTEPPCAPSTCQTVGMQATSISSSFEICGLKARKTENKSEDKAICVAQHHPANMNMVNAKGDSSMIPLQAVNKQHQLSQLSFAMHENTAGNFSAPSYPTPFLSTLSSHVAHRGTPTPLRPTQFMNVMNVPRYEPQKIGSAAMQVDKKIQILSANLIHTGANAKTPQKKPSAGQKKPYEALASAPPKSNKKQKTTGAFLVQSIEQQNDVTAISGVNLREEQERLLYTNKVDSRASEATRRVVLEEEDILLLQKSLLRKKMDDIILKCGLKSMSNDVLRCLSMCVEEHLRNLITDSVRLSKQRIDTERTWHQFVITSDVRQQILTVNMKAKEKWDKKQTKEAGKHHNSNQVSKEEDDRMRTTTANVAARAAVGGYDMLSKWQIMAEQALQKHQGVDGASGLNLGSKPSAKLSRREQQDSANRGHSGSPVPGSINWNTQGACHTKVSRCISVKDIIGAIERKTQMSKSSLINRLYERLSSEYY